MLEGLSEKKIKVLFVIPCMAKGGAERVLSILLEHLDRDKIKPLCIFYEEHKTYEIPDDVEAYYLDLPGTDSLYGKITYAIRRVLKIRKIFYTEKPDIIFSFISTVNIVVILAWLLLSQNIKKRLKLFVSVRTYLSIDIEGDFYKVTKCFIKTLYPKANKIITNSKKMKKDLIDNFNLCEDKIEVIYNPLDIAKIEKLCKEEVKEHAWFREDIPIVINVGSLNRSYQKGHDYLLKTFKKVREKKHVRLVIIGGGEGKEELERLSLELGINNDVALLGFQNNPFKFIRRSSAFVLSSRFEGFPNVLLEAMACKIPVISTRCPSGPEEIIVDQVNGLLVPVEDEEKLVDAIIRVVDNKDFSDLMVSEAKKTVSQFDVKSTIVNYEKIFF